MVQTSSSRTYHEGRIRRCGPLLRDSRRQQIASRLICWVYRSRRLYHSPTLASTLSHACLGRRALDPPSFAFAFVRVASLHLHEKPQLQNRRARAPAPHVLSIMLSPVDPYGSKCHYVCPPSGQPVERPSAPEGQASAGRNERGNHEQTAHQARYMDNHALHVFRAERDFRHGPAPGKHHPTTKPRPRPRRKRKRRQRPMQPRRAIRPPPANTSAAPAKKSKEEQENRRG